MIFAGLFTNYVFSYISDNRVKLESEKKYLQFVFRNAFIIVSENFTTTTKKRLQFCVGEQTPQEGYFDHLNSLVPDSQTPKFSSHIHSMSQPGVDEKQAAMSVSAPIRHSLNEDNDACDAMDEEDPDVRISRKAFSVMRSVT